MTEEQAITKWENDSGIPDIKRSAINQRNRNCKLYLFAVIGFSFALFCWFISLLLNVADGNIAAAVLSGINTTLLGVPIGLFSRKYFDAKKTQ